MEQKAARKNSNLGNLLRIGAIAVPWLCTLTLPVLRIDGFCMSALRAVFFEFVMVPFGNLALLGITANGQDRSFGLILFLALAGIVLPPAIALLFAHYWKRWQFALVWLAYVVLLAVNAVLATYIAVILVEEAA